MGNGAVEALLKAERRAELFVKTFKSKDVDSLNVSKNDLFVAMDGMIYSTLCELFPKNRIIVIKSPDGIGDPSLMGQSEPYPKMVRTIDSALKKASWL